MKKKFDSRLAYLILSIFIPIAIFLTLPSHIPYQPKITLSIMMFCLILWVSEIAPLSIVGLFGVVLTVISGILDIKNAFSGFSNPVILLMIGSFLMANAINKYGLDKRISLHLLSLDIFSKSPFSMLIGLSLITFLLSMWLSNTATTAMMLPIGIGILSLLKREDGHHFRLFSSLFLLSIAYSASLGGIGTIVGSPTNLVGLGFLNQEGIHITFLDWSLYALSISFLSYTVLLLYIRFKIRKFNIDVDKGSLKEIIEYQKKGLSKISFAEKAIGISFIVTVLLWISPSIFLAFNLEDISKLLSKYIPESTAIVLTTSILFIIPKDRSGYEPILNTNDLKMIDWDTIILFASGLSLGKAIEESGLGKIIGNIFSNYFHDKNVYLFLFALIFFTIIATEIISNTAAAITFIPIVIYSLKALGIDITYPVLSTIIAASLAFILPISTPPNAIVYSTKMIPIKTMIKTGVFLDIIGGVIIFVFLILFRGG